MARRRQIFESKAKILFEGPEPGTLVQYFKDDVAAVNPSTHGVITGKGVLNNRISEYLMTRLGEMGIPTNFVRRLNMREQLVREVEMIPVVVVIRNHAAGSFARRFRMGEGQQLPRSIVEFFYKAEDGENPLVSEEHVTAFGWATPQDLDEIMSLSLRVNDFLSGLFLGIGMRLVDIRCEFGRLWEEDQMRMVLADEICLNSCRMWDLRTGVWLDRDRFRGGDFSQLADAYQEVARRLNILPESGPLDPKATDTIQ